MHLLNVGDVALLDEYLTHETWEIPEYSDVDGEIRMLFNWEFPIGDEINPNPRVSGPRYKAHSDAPPILRKWVPSYAALANNHVLDAGEQGLFKTMQTFKDLGFTIVGAGNTVEEIKRPVFWETSEGILAIVNWVFPETHPECESLPGPNCWPGVQEAEQTIQDLKSQVDWVLIRAHWSDEAFAYPRPEDRIMARELARIGADVVIGDHPHVVRGMEVINSCPVYYSIGNYYFSHERTYNDSWNQRALRNHVGLGVQVSFRRGEAPVCTPRSFLKLKQRVVKDITHRAEYRLNRVSQPLQQFQGKQYAEWYKQKRAAFVKWGYKVHFRLWNLSRNDVKRILLRR
jgi:hypothetical protein